MEFGFDGLWRVGLQEAAYICIVIYCIVIVIDLAEVTIALWDDCG